MQRETQPRFPFLLSAKPAGSQETVLSARKALISIQGLRIEAEEFTLSEKAKVKSGPEKLQIGRSLPEKKKKTQAILMT